jgi:biotin operon repressor
MQLETVDEGWVKLHRKIGKSSVFQNEGLLKVWIWCLIRANHQDEWVPITTGKGKTVVLIKRGQFVYGRKSAAKALKMDESTIYKRMMKLKNMGNCNIESNTHYSIVSVINWDAYQSTSALEVTPKDCEKRLPHDTFKKSQKRDTQNQTVSSQYNEGYEGVPNDEVTPKEHPSNTNKNDKNEPLPGLKPGVSGPLT